MGRMYRNIILFALPVLILIAILPVDQRLKYQGLRDDCYNHAIWIFDRIYNNPKDIDIAFLGSSRTINGINDQLISDGIGSSEAVNFGYCRFGRNLNLVLLREIIHAKKLKKVVIEVREDEDRFSHPIFPYMARSRDALLPSILVNRVIIGDTWTHLAYKMELIQDLLYQQEPPAPVNREDFGFGPSEGVVPAARLEEIEQSKSLPVSEPINLVQNFHSSFARSYLRKISKICLARDIEVYFLYLPAYGSFPEKPNEYNTYLKYGKVLIPPGEIFENRTNWYDENHFNQVGANELSLWITEQVELN